jgi:tetratricopeptide (TPR) repeat protein
VLLPSVKQWRAHIAWLERRAAKTEGLDAARLHHQRAVVLNTELAEPVAATAAWEAALAADPNLTSARRALRAHLVALDDETRCAAQFTLRPADGPDARALAATLWLFRWPNPDRAQAALLAAPVDPLLDRLARLGLSDAALHHRLSHRSTPLETTERVLLARLLVERGEDAHAQAVIGTAQDPRLAWLRVESATDDATLAEALVTLADLCCAATAGALCYLAAEQLNGAEALLARAEGGALDDVIALGRVLRGRRRVVFTDALTQCRVQDPTLQTVLDLRSAERLWAAGDADTAWARTEAAWRRHPGLALPLLERLVVADARWAAWAALIDETPPTEPMDRLVAAAVFEHALHDAPRARAALGPMDQWREDAIYALQTAQRLASRTGDESCRVWQIEARNAESADHRVHLFLNIARHYLDQPNGLDRALTYLFWVLDHDPAHHTALRLLAHACRGGRRTQPLIEVLTRLETLLDDDPERATLLSELGALHEATDPESAVALYARAVALAPRLLDAVVGLERACLAAEAFDTLATLYREQIALAQTPAHQAELGLRLGLLLEGRLGEPEAALGVYRLALSADPEGPAAAQLHEICLRLQPPLPSAPTGTLEFDVPLTDPDQIPFAASEQFEALLTRVTGETLGTATQGTDLMAPKHTAPLPTLAPLPDHTPMPALRLSEPPTNTPKAPAEDPADVSTSGVVEHAMADFLGTERTRAAAEDPARAAVRRKLARARSGGAGEWPDHGKATIADAVAALRDAPGADARFAAALILADAYEAHDAWSDAVRAWRAALGWRAGAAEAETRLEALYRRTEQFPALAELLAGRAQRTGDAQRRRTLLIEVARLYSGPMKDPGSAVPHFRDALTLGHEPALVLELAEALKAIRKWIDYVAVLHGAGLDAPNPQDPEWTLQMGRVHLYELRDAEHALPFILAAARALPDRVDVAADLAEVRAAMGAVDQAVELLERCLAGMSDAAWTRERATLSLRLARLIETFGDDPERVRLAYRSALTDGVRDPAVIDRCERLATEARDYSTLAVAVNAAFEEADLRHASPRERRTILARLGHLYAQQLGEPGKAAEAFVRGFEIDPTDVETFRTARGLVERLADAPLQVRLYQAWLTQAPLDSPERLGVGLGLVGALEDEGRLDEAVEHVEALAAASPGARAAQHARERVLRNAGRWHTLVAIYQQTLSQTTEPEDRLALLRKLATAQEVGLRDLEAATSTWRAVLAEAPADAKALRALARLLESRKQWNALLNISRQELAITTGAKQRAYILFRMGSLQETHLDDRAAAGQSYRDALEADRRCFPALHGLRDLAVEAQDWPAVVANLESEHALWTEPKEQAAVLARIAEIHDTRLSDRVAAIKYYRAALGTWPNSVPAARFLGNLAYSEARWTDAAPLFHTLSAQKLEKWSRAARADLFHKRGVVALELGRQREAVESLKLSLDFEPAGLPSLEALVAAAGAPPTAEDEAEIRARINAARQAQADAAQLDVIRGHAAEATADREAAMAAYARAAEARPDDLDLYLPQVALLVIWRRWAEATQVLRSYAERLAPRVIEQPALQARYIEALEREGAIWSDLAGEPARAIECYRRVLVVQPQRRQATWHQAQCQVLQGAHSDARTLMRRMLAYTGELPPEEHGTYLFYLGRIEQLGFDDAAAAEQLYRRALAIDPGCASAALGLLQLLDARDDTAQLLDAVAALRPLVKRPPEGPAGAALRTYVAGLRLRHDDPQGALTLLEPMAAGDAPGSRAARFALVQVYDRAQDVNRAARPLLTLLDHDVTDVDALQTLAALLERYGEHERLLHVLSVLELFRALTPELKATFDTLSTRARHRRESANRPLSPAALSSYVTHASFGSPLVSLVGLCAPALAERFDVGEPPDLKSATHITGRRHAFSFQMRAIISLLDHRAFDLYFHDTWPEPIGIWPGARPTIVVGAPLLGTHSTQALHFLVARAVFYCKAGLASLYNLAYGRRLSLFRTLDALYVPGQGAQDAAEELINQLNPQTAAAVRDIIVRAGTQTLPTAWTGETVMSSVTSTADRLGLLANGALRPSIEALLRLADDALNLPPAEDLRWAVRGAPRLRDLIKFSLSESHARARHAADLALDPADVSLRG